MRHSRLGFITSQRILLIGMLCFSATIASAEPPLTNQNSANQNNASTEEVDPQAAPSPATPFNNNSDTPDALANPDSLASQMHPSETDLSAANQQLLSQNAQLQRDVNALETRVNVLINERSGQLFMYGAITVSVALFFGFLLGWFFFGRRDRW